MILQTIFDQTTTDIFLAGPKVLLGSRRRVGSVSPGDHVLLQNKTKKEVFGIGIVQAFEDGSVIREHHLLDPDTYSQEYAKYNKWELPIKFVPINISYDKLAKLLGIDNRFPNNITQTRNVNFARLFYKHPNDEMIVVERVGIFLETHL